MVKPLQSRTMIHRKQRNNAYHPLLCGSLYNCCKLWFPQGRLLIPEQYFMSVCCNMKGWCVCACDLIYVCISLRPSISCVINAPASNTDPKQLISTPSFHDLWDILQKKTLLRQQRGLNTWCKLSEVVSAIENRWMQEKKKKKKGQISIYTTPYFKWGKIMSNSPKI